MLKGFLDGYTKWTAHGEKCNSSRQSTSAFCVLDNSDDLGGFVQDSFPMCEGDNSMEDISASEDVPNQEAGKFFKTLKDAEQALYPGCSNFSKLSFIMRPLQIKCLGKWSDKSFSMRLELLKESFPEGVQLPKNNYEARKTLTDLGLHYEKIDACKNDCMIYWGVNESKTKCDTCNEPQWKVSKDEVSCATVSKKNRPKKKRKNVAYKTFWHFPLKPRLQRLFMCARIANLMKWHSTERTNDGIMRHPADSPAWQTFDHLHPDFAKDPRNIRLGLAADGFNPFRSKNTNHSTWPIILVPYNLPPGECMKQSYFMLSTLIPGPDQPGNDIDVYLEPLIMELKELWDVGLNTYDASVGENFQMRAGLLWTTSDLPGLANLSGWSTKGKYACPVCGKDTNSEYLEHSHKHCYMSHRIFLPADHPYRSDTRSFVGKVEHRSAPPYPSGSHVLDEIKDIRNKFGKKVGRNFSLSYNWKKISRFFELPYWGTNLLHHNLNFMHVEKNVSEKCVDTLMGTEKSKDNKQARLDLEARGIRPGLHPFIDENGKEWLPAACFTFDKNEKKQFCEVLQSIKVPDGYAANISKRVTLKPPKIIGLKSHDNHILMQQLMPVALRNLLPASVRTPIIQLCRFFRDVFEITP